MESAAPPKSEQDFINAIAFRIQAKTTRTPEAALMIARVTYNEGCAALGLKFGERSPDLWTVAKAWAWADEELESW